jgi:hypothetical protein
MKSVSSLAILAALSLAIASPAIAEVSIPKGEVLCEKAVVSADAANKSAKVRKNDTSLSNGDIVYQVRVTKTDGAKAMVECRVNRETSETVVTPSV